MTRTVVRCVLVAIALAALLPAAALAQSSIVTSIGPRVGFSIDPDQFVVGGQISVGELAPSLMFVPSLELGFGDGRTVVAGNFDVQYRFSTNASWRPYVGAGMAINNETVDRETGASFTETEVGGTIIIGAIASATPGSSLFGELKLGLGDIPEMKVTAGWNFKI